MKTIVLKIDIANPAQSCIFSEDTQYVDGKPTIFGNALEGKCGKPLTMSANGLRYMLAGYAETESDVEAFVADVADMIPGLAKIELSRMIGRSMAWLMRSDDEQSATLTTRNTNARHAFATESAMLLSLVERERLKDRVFGGIGASGTMEDAKKMYEEDAEEGVSMKLN